ncbi:hypothetical protein [Celeribacter neptunius]|uniref:Uncharacterized protein n=1 Tax=Celeribacter neptunius TaxID=588602 RepID=A0A1I3S5Z6_9RHOB|nr:hypothetical protein [Celeribacter neptunius]SFJ52997.1 hypothetical protein SAMN04487991_2312 [Celeribacter neptunius]
MKLTKFTAGLLALSLATAGISAAPARASEKDTALALGGLLTLFVIGKAIEDQKDKATVSRAPAPQPQPRVQDRDRYREQDRYRDRYAGQSIPNQCVLSAGRSGSQRLVAFETCIEREARRNVDLPRACETRVRTDSHWRDAYDVTCLSNFGYRVTANRQADRSDWNHRNSTRISTRSHD